MTSNTFTFIYIFIVIAKPSGFTTFVIYSNGKLEKWPLSKYKWERDFEIRKSNRIPKNHSYYEKLYLYLLSLQDWSKNPIRVRSLLSRDET